MRVFCRGGGGYGSSSERVFIFGFVRVGLRGFSIMGVGGRRKGRRFCFG